jgi:hypothetical protein
MITWKRLFESDTHIYNVARIGNIPIGSKIPKQDRHQKAKYFIGEHPQTLIKFESEETLIKFLTV